VRDPDPKVAGRAFSGAAIELALASYPGFHVTAPPSDASPYGVYQAEYVPAEAVEHTAVLPDGRRVAIAPAADTLPLADVEEPQPPPPLTGGPTSRAPLGTVLGARSGDKGGNANLGVWARPGINADDGYRWLAHALTTEKLRELLPETAELPIQRHPLPNLRAVNFVIEGLLGLGVAAQHRFDPQAKALGEWLRARTADIPDALR
jgi:hypothetical protein